MIPFYSQIQPIRMIDPKKYVEILSYFEKEMLLEAHIHFSYFYLLNKILT